MEENLLNINEMLPKVTIMIPTYNQENFISDAIKSALEQDYENLEIVISDDNSSDRTSEIAQGFLSDGRVKYFKNVKNIGRVANYHKTLYEHSTGDWIVNLDGDDYYTDPAFISRAMNRILSQENIVCYFGLRYMPDKLKSHKKMLIDTDCYVFNGKFYLCHFFEIGRFSHLVTLYKKELCLIDNKCYTYQGLQSDFHGIIRYCVHGNIIVAKENKYIWRVHGENASHSMDYKNKLKDELLCQNLIMEDVKDYYSADEIKDWLKKGEKWAKNDYMVSRLQNCSGFKTLILGLIHFNWSRNYTIIYIKSLLLTLFRVNLFRKNDRLGKKLPLDY